MPRPANGTYVNTIERCGLVVHCCCDKYRSVGAPDDRVTEHAERDTLAARLARVETEMRARADEYRNYPVNVPCQCEPSWHAFEIDKWTEALASVSSPPTLSVVVNGQPVEVPAGQVRDVIRQAIERAGQIGAPIEQWELRTRDGDVIPHDLEAGWQLTGGRLLFLNLGLPRRRSHE